MVAVVPFLTAIVLSAVFVPAVWFPFFHQIENVHEVAFIVALCCLLQVALALETVSRCEALVPSGDVSPVPKVYPLPPHVPLLNELEYWS